MGVYMYRTMDGWRHTKCVCVCETDVLAYLMCLRVCVLPYGICLCSGLSLKNASLLHYGTTKDTHMCICVCVYKTMGGRRVKHCVFVREVVGHLECVCVCVCVCVRVCES